MSMVEYTVGQVSDLLGASAATVRRWSQQFSAHLSPGANPGKGVERTFSQDDVKVFAYVKKRLDLGVSAKVVEGEIETATLPTWSEIVQSRDVIPDDTAMKALTLTGDRLLDTLSVSSSAQERIAGTLDALRLATADVAQVETRVDDLQRQVDDLRRLLDGLTRDVEDLKRHRHRLLQGDILIDGL